MPPPGRCPLSALPVGFENCLALQLRQTGRTLARPRDGRGFCHADFSLPTMQQPPVTTSAADPLVNMRRDAVPRVTFISWAASCSRSDHLAREWGGRSFMVYAAWFGSRPSTILLKYAVQWWRTWRILRGEQPDVVFVMVPPIVAALPAFIYAWRWKKRVALDIHTCAFVLRRWRCVQGLQRLLARRAVTTLVTNEFLANVIRHAGGHATVVPDVPVTFNTEDMESMSDGVARRASFTAMVVCSFDADEPVAAIVQAATYVPDVTLLMTGDAAQFPEYLRKGMPANIRLTGFLPTTAYGRLLRQTDVVVDLTTHDHTMLRGAYEAIYQGTPVVISDWPLLRQEFPRGAVHVENAPAAIAAGIETVRRDLPRFRKEAAALCGWKHERWEGIRASLVARLSNGSMQTA